MGQVGRLRKPRPHACYLYTTREGVVCVRRSSLARKKPTRRVKSLPPCPPTRAPRRLSTSSTRSAPAHRCEFDWQFNTIGFGRIATKNQCLCQWPVNCNWRERTARTNFIFGRGYASQGQLEYGLGMQALGIIVEIRRVRLPHGAQSVLKVGTHGCRWRDHCGPSTSHVTSNCE